MARIIKEFQNGAILEYDQGAFDDYCVYLTQPGKTRYAPRDTEYFNQLVELGKLFTPNAVYDDFVSVYSKTNKSIEKNVLDHITEISQKYNSKASEVEIMYTILYASMIAEMNKQYSRLGKRVKRLGVHQVLFEEFSVYSAANFSKGKPWRELDEYCRKRGF